MAWLHENREMFFAQNLDIAGNDVEQIMNSSKEAVELGLQK